MSHLRPSAGEWAPATGCAGVLTKIRSSPIAASAPDKTGRDARQDLRVKQSFDCRACLRPGSAIVNNVLFECTIRLKYLTN